MTRKRSLLGWILLPITVAVAGIAAMWLFFTVTRPRVHPDPQAIPSVTHQNPPPQSADAVDRARQMLRTGMAEQNLPGLSVAVGVGGDLVWSEGFGWADVEARLPVTPNTRFWIGTASEALTSAAVGALLERRRLALDDEIQSGVPQFPKKQWPLTLRQLMAHTSGLATDEGSEDPLSRQRCEHPDQALSQFAQRPLLFEPGARFQRSQYGWVLVSATVEHAGGQPFLTFMREQIFQPLRMDGTNADSSVEENPDRLGEEEEDPPIATAIRDLVLRPLGVVEKGRFAMGNRAIFYSPGFGPKPVFRAPLHVMRLQNLSCYAGSMAFLSTPVDLVRFGLAINNGALLQPATVRQLLTSQRLTSGQETGYGLGWDVRAVTLAGQPRQAAVSDGELMGRKVMSLVMIRDAGIVVALTSNVAGADTSGLALKVAEEFARR